MIGFYTKHSETAVSKMRCSPFVRQYGIMKIYHIETTEGGHFHAKRYPPEFKIMIAETTHKEGLIPNTNKIQKPICA